MFFFVFVFVYCFFLFLNVLLRGVLRRENKMKDILREAIVEKHHNHVLSSYHYWRCMWLRLSVCEWVFVRIHQGVIWNYFRQTKEHFDCLCFWYWKKKKKDRPVLFWLICSSTLPPSHFIFRLDKIGLLWNLEYYCLYTVAAPCSGEQRGVLGREPEMEQGLAPSRLWFRTSVQTTLAGRRSLKKLEQIQRFAETRSLFVQPSCCSLFDV